MESSATLRASFLCIPLGCRFLPGFLVKYLPPQPIFPVTEALSSMHVTPSGARR